MILAVAAIYRFSVKIMIILAIAKTLKIEMNVFLRLNLENKLGINNPQIAIVNVNELTYNPATAILTLKYSEISFMIPTILKGVFIPIVANIKIYSSIFGLFFIIYNIHDCYNILFV